MTLLGYDRQDKLVGEITTEAFLRDYWRRKPLFVKNGALDILGCTFTEMRFDALLNRLRGDATVQLTERLGEVTFVENLSRYLPELAQRADRYASLLGTAGAWFDGVRTYAASGIGSHFDHSDNFVLQQTGVKRWALSPPGGLARTEVAKRMLQMPGVGSAPVSEEICQEFVLEPGDFLYLPLLWIHSGISAGASVSLSLVCPATPFQSLFLRGVHQVMLDHLLGYQPTPSVHPFLSLVECDAQVEALRNATRALLRKLSSDEVITAIVDRQLAYLRAGQTRCRPSSSETH